MEEHVQSHDGVRPSEAFDHERMARSTAEAKFAQLSTILESISDAFFALDGEWRFIYLNKNAERLLFRSRNDLIGKVVWEEFPEAVETAFFEHYHRAVREGVTVEFEIFYAPLDGWFDVRAYPSSEGLSVFFRNVTEQKLIQDRLRWSEKRYRSLMEATAAILWDANEEGELVSEQPGWGAFTGQSFDEYKGWGWLEAIHPDDRESTAQIWARAVEERRFYQTEHRIKRHDGVYRSMLVRAVPLLADDGSLRQWVGSHTDVTDIREIREQLRSLEERHRFLAEAIPVHVWTALPDGSIDYVNQRCADYFGVQPEELLGSGWLSAVHPADLALIIERWRQSIAAGRPYESEVRLRRAGDGAYRWHLSRGIPFLDASGAILRWFGTNTDIEDQKQAEQARDRALQEARFERERLYEIFMQAPAAIAVTQGPEHLFAVANPLFCQITGRNPTGTYVRQSFPELEGQAFFDLLDGVYSSGQPFIGNEMPAEFDRDGDGVSEIGYFNFVYQPLKTPEGAVFGIMIHAVEVTESVHTRQEIERKAVELEQLSKALERSNQELDQFAYITSHDLKAPLRGIANLSAWIEEDLGSNVPDEVRSHLDLLRGRVLRMEALIDGILEYSRVGRIAGMRERVDVDRLLKDLIDLLAPPEGVTIEITSDMPVLFTERLGLQQVFSNLIDNAIKHRAGADVHIRVSAAQRDTMVEFAVADNGPGIPPQYHDRIFGIFQTLASRDKVEGSGLGLALIKKIVEHQGGKVWLESAIGEGTTFYFTWPNISVAEDLA